MMPRRLTKWAVLAVGAVAAAACSDTLTQASAPAVPSKPEQVVARLDCAADVRRGSLDCAPSTALPPGISPDIILGGQNTYIKLTGFGAGFDNPTTPTTWSAQVQLRNLTVQPMGTRDGVNPSTPAGLKVFFVQLPSNGVTINNADGTGTFTASNQPYYQYVPGNGLFGNTLPAGDFTDTKPWLFDVHGATTFTFSVLVSTTMPDEPGVLLTSTATLPSSTPGVINGIWGSSASNVFAVSDTGEVFRFDGTSWTGGVRPSTRSLNAISGTSASDVWAVGNGGIVVHFNGAAWTTATTLISGGTPVDQLGVFALSPTSVYSAGYGGILWKYNGSSWTAMDVGTGSSTYVHSVFAFSDNDIYIGGGNNTIGGGYFRHWNGISWSDVNTGGLLAGRDVNAIWGSSPTDIWAAGFQGLLLHFNGTSWTAVNSVTGIDPNDNFLGASGTASNDVWFVSYTGTRLHWDGTQLVNFDPRDGLSPTSVFSAARKRVFMGGYDGFGASGPAKIVIDYKR